jgi:Cys-tRNA(Pro)/Cys-tRNA(Cys) deacylase
VTPDTPAVRAVVAAGIEHSVLQYGKVAHIEEAARRRGVPVSKVMKSLVVRTGEDEYVMVIVPGDRVIDWPKLRELLGESRMSLAPADEAYEATGYHRGAITPFGSRRRLPVVCDSSISGEISIGGGAHGVAIHLQASDLVAFAEATVADVTKPA